MPAARKSRKTSEEQTAGEASTQLEEAQKVEVAAAGEGGELKRKNPPRGKGGKKSSSLEEDSGSSALPSSSPAGGSAGVPQSEAAEVTMGSGGGSLADTEVKMATTMAVAASGFLPSQAAAGQGIVKQALYRLPQQPE